MATQTDIGTRVDPALRHQLVELLTEQPQISRSTVTELVRRQYPLAPLYEVEAFVSGFALSDGAYGAIDTLLVDPTIEEILINGPGVIWIDRDGQMQPSTVSVSALELEVMIERLLAPSGLRASRSTPIVDAMLPGGQRVNVVLPPLAIDGPTVCVRKFAVAPLSPEAFGPPEFVEVISDLVESGKSLLIVGATSSGKTSLLNAISQLIPLRERVVCIEDRSELQLAGNHVVKLEARSSNSEGVGEVTLRDLIRTSLRMRPDRIVVGEVRGAEALDLLLAMTTGHAGSLSTCHAAAALGGLRRLATLAGLADVATSMEVIERTVFEAVDAVVVVRRGENVRYVETIHEVPPDPVLVENSMPLLWAASRPEPTLELVSQ